jgi:hypothetical protein
VLVTVLWRSGVTMSRVLGVLFPLLFAYLGADWGFGPGYLFLRLFSACWENSELHMGIRGVNLIFMVSFSLFQWLIVSLLMLASS